jgi:ribose transport system permease protein
LPLLVITAVAVGGTDIFGGEGAMWRTMVGLTLLTVISTAFDLSNVEAVYEQLVVGGLLLAAVGADARLRPGRSR